MLFAPDTGGAGPNTQRQGENNMTEKNHNKDIVEGEILAAAVNLIQGSPTEQEIVLFQKKVDVIRDIIK